MWNTSLSCAHPAGSTATRTGDGEISWTLWLDWTTTSCTSASHRSDPAPLCWVGPPPFPLQSLRFSVHSVFSLQNLPLSALSAGRTLSNLLALVTHTELGRSAHHHTDCYCITASLSPPRQGAFECHPELAVFRGSASGSEVVRDLENEPPSFYTADQTPGGQGEDNSDSEVEMEEEEEEEKGEEWESVDARSAVHQRRGRRRGRLGYESSYLDYMAMGTSRGAEGEGQGQEEAAAGGVGLFGTLSSLLSSTFRST